MGGPYQAFFFFLRMSVCLCENELCVCVRMQYQATNVFFENEFWWILYCETSVSRCKNVDLESRKVNDSDGW